MSSDDHCQSKTELKACLKCVSHLTNPASLSCCVLQAAKQGAASAYKSGYQAGQQAGYCQGYQAGMKQQAASMSTAAARTRLRPCPLLLPVVPEQASADSPSAVTQPNSSGSSSSSSSSSSGGGGGGDSSGSSGGGGSSGNDAATLSTLDPAALSAAAAASPAASRLGPAAAQASTSAAAAAAAVAAPVAASTAAAAVSTSASAVEAATTPVAAAAAAACSGQMHSASSQGSQKLPDGDSRGHRVADRFASNSQTSQQDPGTLLLELPLISTTAITEASVPTGPGSLCASDTDVAVTQPCGGNGSSSSSNRRNSNSHNIELVHIMCFEGSMHHPVADEADECAKPCRTSQQSSSIVLPVSYDDTMGHSYHIKVVAAAARALSAGPAAAAAQCGAYLVPANMAAGFPGSRSLLHSRWLPSMQQTAQTMPPTMLAVMLMQLLPPLPLLSERFTAAAASRSYHGRPLGQTSSGSHDPMTAAAAQKSRWVQKGQQLQQNLTGSRTAGDSLAVNRLSSALTWF